MMCICLYMKSIQKKTKQILQQLFYSNTFDHLDHLCHPHQSKNFFFKDIVILRCSLRVLIVTSNSCMVTLVFITLKKKKKKGESKSFISVLYSIFITRQEQFCFLFFLSLLIFFCQLVNLIGL